MGRARQEEQQRPAGVEASDATPLHWRFAAFEFQTQPSQLTRAGQPIALKPQPVRGLALLLRRAGDVGLRWPLGIALAALAALAFFAIARFTAPVVSAPALPGARNRQRPELAYAYRILGQTDRALEALRLACETLSGWSVAFIAVDPRFAALHADPRWAETLADCRAPVSS